MLFVLFLWTLKLSLNSCNYAQDQSALHRYLDSKQINPLVIPQVAAGIGLQINFHFYLNQIIEADAARSIFSADGLIVISYQDFQQSWNSTEYGEIEEIERDPNSCWYPSVLLLGGLQRTVFEPVGKVRILHKPPKVATTISYDITSMFSVSCLYQVFKFPFDDHICTLKFQPSSLSSEKAYFVTTNNSDDGLSDHFVNHVEWDIKEIRRYTENHTEKETGTTTSAYQTIIFISRRSASYMISILLPAIGLMIVSFVIFLLPPESGEKIGLSITVLLSYTVFNLTLYTALPKSKTICLVGWLMAYLELLSVIAILLSGLVLRCYYRPRNQDLEKWALCIIAAWDFCRRIRIISSNKCQGCRKKPTWQEFAVFLDILFIYLYLIIYTVMIIVSTYFFIY